jgi:hypothetical protein
MTTAYRTLTPMVQTSSSSLITQRPGRPCRQCTAGGGISKRHTEPTPSISRLSDNVYYVLYISDVSLAADTIDI